jgi:hypothetical protein
MSARTFEVRLLAAVLLVAWGALALLLVGNHLVLLGAVAALPAAISGWTLLRPMATPAGRPGHRGARLAPALAWRAVGVLAGLLTVSLAMLAADPLLADQRNLQLPSAEMNYAALLALLLTVVYCMSHVSLESSRVLIALALAIPALLGGIVLATAARPADVPDECAVPLVGDAAEVTITASAEIDGEIIGEGILTGARRAGDERWSVVLSGQASPFETAAMVVSDGRTWLRHDGADWQPIAGAAPAVGGWLDARLAQAISRRPLPAMEDLGLETLAGVAVRRCRIYIDGVSAATAVPLLAWLTGTAPPETRTRLVIWRGEVDWWMGRDGRMQHATIIIGGLPADPWGARGMRGRLTADISVSEPTEPPTIEEPRP